MNIHVTVIAVTFLICATIIIYRLIDFYREKAKGVDNYWRGRYCTLESIFDRAGKYTLTDEVLSDIEERLLKG